jgi:protease-4
MLEADSIVANRQMRRRLGVWRIVAILAIALSLGVLVLWGAGANGGLSKFSDHIARVRVEGLITGDRKTLKMLEELGKADRVKGVIIHIDSPGGTTAGSEAIYEAIRKIAEDKPVTAVLGTVAASGGYITAIATDHIVARGNTITGSIGVIFQWAEVSQLFDRLGIKMETIKSSDLKAEPNMFNPLTDKVREVTQVLIQDSYDWFVGLVAERRNLAKPVALRLADGRVYSGRQAVENKLIDELGGEKQAKAWLVKQKKLDADMEIVDWTPKAKVDPTGLGLSLLATILKGLGIEHSELFLSKVLQPDSAKLDGLLSVWHPSR